MICCMQHVVNPILGLVNLMYDFIMQLKEWLVTNDITLSQFALRIGSSRGAVMKWVSGERFPRTRMLIEIERATNGEVTAIDFHEKAKQVRR